MWEQWVNVGITLLLLVFGAGKMLGWLQERTELRDWKEWRRQVDDRFDDASERTSKLAGAVNAMPMQIEDRAVERFMDKALAAEKFQGLDRRVTAIEEQQRGRA